MNISKPAVIVAAVAMVIGGGMVADAATTTTTSPVKLCSNKLLGVELPKNGTCPKGTTQFFVASPADVAALAGRVDRADDLNLTQSGSLDALKKTNDELALQLKAQADDLAAFKATLEPKLVALDFFAGGDGCQGSIGDIPIGMTVKGSALKPGSAVTFVPGSVFDGQPHDVGVVGSDRTITILRNDTYTGTDAGPFHFEGTDVFGSPVRSPDYDPTVC